MPRSTYAKKEIEESSYYTIDNTEDIYGMKLSPAERCYIDPWDLENYDYVRRKVDYPSSPTNIYSTGKKSSKNIYASAPNASNYEKFQPFCNDTMNYGYLRYSPEIYNEHFYGTNDLCLLNNESTIHHGYEEFSTSSNQSSTENDAAVDFAYSISPYAPYDCCNCYSLYESCGGQRKSSSASNIYGEPIYANKFGLSNKGLLQIDYSYNWDDLDRAIGANYYFKAN